MAADEVGSVHCIDVENFTDHPHLRILAMQGVGQLANETSRHVLNCVLANAVDAGGANPPKCVLNFVPHDLRLFLVHVRQVVIKPAVQRVQVFIPVCVRRKQRAVLKTVAIVMRERAVKPVSERRIGDPGMSRANMIRHLVLNYLQTQRVSFLDQLTQRLHIAKAIFDRVIIDRVVAVIVSAWTPGTIAVVHAVPIVVPGIQPERSHAKVLEIAELIDNAAQIAAMKGARILSIVGGGRRIGRRIVRWVAVGKTIRHDQIDDIAGRDSLKMRSGGERRRNRKRNRRVAVRREQRERVRSRTRGWADRYTDEEIGRARVNQNLRSLDNWISGTNLRPTEVFSAHQQADRVNAVSRPPRWRLDFGY